jgi:purine-binding chemotaxis protein CheW
VVLVRGQIIPALNLRTRFGFEKVERDLRSRLVVINTGARTVGLLVDAAREFLRISTDAIEPPPQALTGLSGHYLEGVATIAERMILILNLDAVLDLEYENGREDYGSDAREFGQQP